MSGRQKRSMNGCQLISLVVAEGIAVVAAIIAITGTYWLEPNVTPTGSVLPGVSNAGLWRVCYDDPAVPSEFVNGNRTYDALLLELGGTNPGGTSLLADDLTVNLRRQMLQATTSDTVIPNPDIDAPRRAGATTIDNADRVLNTTKVSADIQRDFAENLPFSRTSSEGCTKDMTLYSSIWNTDYHARLQATRGLTLIFLLCGILKVMSVIFAVVFCATARGSEGYITLIQVLAGWAGWLVYLWVLLDVAGAGEAQRAAAAKGVEINVDAASHVVEYWGHSFWLFLAATLASSLGALFSLC